MPHGREEQDIAEQHGEETHRIDEHGGVGDTERAGREQAEVEDRLLVAA
jgi:hypothetical protein